MSEGKVDSGRRSWIAITCGAGAVGGAAVAVPFVASFAPSERAKAAGAPVQADISALRPGEKLTVEWRGKPVWIVRRTEEQLAALPKLDGQLADPFSKRNPAELTPEYARNVPRSIKPEVFVCVGICSHLGCSPVDRFATGAQPSLPDDWAGGFSAPATAPPSTWPGGCSRTSRRPTTSKCLATCTFRHAAADRRRQGPNGTSISQG